MYVCITKVRLMFVAGSLCRKDNVCVERQRDRAWSEKSVFLDQALLRLVQDDGFSGPGGTSYMVALSGPKRMFFRTMHACMRVCNYACMSVLQKLD